MRERSLVLAHQVNDVTQRLDGHLVALQGGGNDLSQLLDDSDMLGCGNGYIRECGHDLATEHCQLLGRDIFFGEALLNLDGLGAQAQVVRPPVFGESALDSAGNYGGRQELVTYWSKMVGQNP